MKFVPGDRVITTEGCGMSNRIGTVIPWSQVPMRKDGSRIPDLVGHYQAPNRNLEVPIQDSFGIFLMFPQYLKKINDGR